MSNLEYYLTLAAFAIGIIALFVLVVKRHTIIAGYRRHLINRSLNQVIALNERRRREQRDREIWGRGL